MPPVRRPVETRDRFVEQFGDQPVRYVDALAAGFTPRALRTAVERNLLGYVRRGMLRATEPSTDGQSDRHAIDVRAALERVATGAMASFDSAALLQGVAKPSARMPVQVQLVSPDAANFTAPGLVLRSSPVPLRDRTVVDGVPCTSIARTAVDLARGRRLSSALIPLDSAARLLVAEATGTSGNALRHAVRVPENRAAARRELAGALDALFGWAGTVAVREALTHVDPASESAAESRSRGWFIEAGLGPLHPGTPIRSGAHTYWADFCDPGRRVIGEADGWSKYGDTAPEMRQAMERERARERDLVADGWRLVRWTSTDPRATVLYRMSQALRLA